MTAIPQGLQDALNACMRAKDDADAALLNKQGTAAGLVAAQAADAQAAGDLDVKTQALSQARKSLEAIVWCARGGLIHGA